MHEISHPISFAGQIASLADLVAKNQAEKDAYIRKVKAAQEKSRKTIAARRSAGELPIPQPKAKKISATEIILAVMVPDKGYRWGDLFAATGLSKEVFSPSLSYLVRTKQIRMDDFTRASIYHLNR